MKIIKENLPWIAPTAAIVLFGTGFFDRVTDAFTGGDTAAPAVVAATTVANVAVPTAAETVPVFVAPEPAAVVFAVAEPDTSTAARLAALVEAASIEPEVTRGDTAGTLAVAPIEPAFVSEGVGTGADAAAFFANAQANLTANDTCADDLTSLAASSRIYFPSGGLAGADAGLSQARLLGQVLRDCPGFAIQVEGHSDPSGDPAINQRLSLQRAQAVVSRLAASGINIDQFKAVGFGDLRPSGVTGTESAAFYDRRVEFSII
jgi:outer membrane protein OmpA-like peptidoglycan-associated protein